MRRVLRDRLVVNGWVVVLAGGRSRRFGRSKARLVWGPEDEPLLTRVVRVARAAVGIVGVIVVVPGSDRGLADLLAVDTRSIVVVNEAAALGMASSIAAGVTSAREQGADFVVLAAVDQPLVEAADFEALARAIEDGAPAAAATYAGIVGIPAAFAHASFAALSALEGDRGARIFLRDEPIVGLVCVAMEHAAVDVDTETDYLAARREAGLDVPARARAR